MLRFLSLQSVGQYQHMSHFPTFELTSLAQLDFLGGGRAIGSLPIARRISTAVFRGRARVCNNEYSLKI